MGDAPGELREDIPLKSGTRSKRFCCGDDCLGESKLISVSFAVLSVGITFALMLQIYYGDYQVAPHGSVATDSRECSEIGTRILKQGGNAADATIASAICLAVVNPHATSLDAEGQFMTYSHRQRTDPTVVNFKRTQTNKSYTPIPRMIIGLAYIHQHYGSLSWSDLIQPSIDVAKKGFQVSKALASAIRNTKATNLYGRLEAGQLLTMTKLAVTLENIAKINEEDLYNYITLENGLTVSTALKSNFNHYHIYVPPAPMIGPELLVNLHSVEQFNFTEDDAIKPQFLYRLGEMAKTTYDDFNITSTFHEGTSSNVAVIDKDDNYVSLVTGMYQLFGSLELSGDGYILDKHTSNKVLCSRIPIIITDANFICGRRLVFGANNIITATQIIALLLIGSSNATNSIEAPRYNIFANGIVGFEDDHDPLFSDEAIEYLEALGRPIHINEPYSSTNMVEKVGDNLNSHSDSRGGGIASRFR